MSRRPAVADEEAQSTLEISAALSRQALPRTTLENSRTLSELPRNQRRNPQILRADHQGRHLRTALESPREGSTMKLITRTQQVWWRECTVRRWVSVQLPILELPRVGPSCKVERIFWGLEVVPHRWTRREQPSPSRNWGSSKLWPRIGRCFRCWGERRRAITSSISPVTRREIGRPTLKTVANVQVREDPAEPSP